MGGLVSGRWSFVGLLVFCLLGFCLRLSDVLSAVERDLQLVIDAEVECFGIVI